MIKKVLFLVAFSAIFFISNASPFDRTFNITNSKGKQVLIHGEGDEFDAVFETVDGYTILSKGEKNQYFYALKMEDGSLIPSDVEIGQETKTIPSSLEKHLRDTSETHEREV